MAKQVVDNKEIIVNFTEGEEGCKDYINISIDFKKAIAVEKGTFDNDDMIKEYIQEVIADINESIDEYCDEIYEELNEDLENEYE